MTTLFVGLDPSLSSTGVVVLSPEGATLAAVSVKVPLEQAKAIARVVEIRRQVFEIIESCAAMADHVQCAVEGYAYSGRSFTVAQLVEVGTSLRLGILDRGWAYSDISPSAVKAFALMPGRPKAKDKPFKEAKALWGFEHKSGDVVDAYVIAQAARAKAGRVGTALHARQLDVLVGMRTAAVAATCTTGV